MTHCRTCGRLLQDDSSTCGSIPCLRVDLAALRAIVTVRGQQDLLRLRLREALKGLEVK